MKFKTRELDFPSHSEGLWVREEGEEGVSSLPVLWPLMLGFTGVLLLVNTSVLGLQHRSQSPGSKSAGWDLLQPHGKASRGDAPCSHAHVSLRRKHRFKHKFKLLKLGPRFPIGRSICYRHMLYTARSVPLSSLTSHPAPAPAKSANVVQSRKHMVRRGTR